jgi:hypothetical protein
MPETYFSLTTADQAELLDTAAARSGRPAHLLEKDVWIVWTLACLFSSPLADKITLKGGTSLSKAYNVIDRFSEDIDLTYDIRRMLPDMATEPEGIPPTSSQAAKRCDSECSARRLQQHDSRRYPVGTCLAVYCCHGTVRTPTNGH